MRINEGIKMKILLTCLLLALCPLYAESVSNDPVFVSKQETDSSYIYTLYHKTNNSLQKIYEHNAEDGSSIEYLYRYRDNILDYDCISLYNNACACSQYIFFDRQTKIFYITKNSFDLNSSDVFSIEKQSLNFKDKTLILYSDKKAKHITDISSSDGYILNSVGKRILVGIFNFPIGIKRLDGISIDQNK
jgi:hypothetical protein